eukprot:964012-Rhodomonas_salina.3
MSDSHFRASEAIFRERQNSTWFCLGIPTRLGQDVPAGLTYPLPTLASSCAERIGACTPSRHGQGRASMVTFASK